MESGGVSCEREGFVSLKHCNFQNPTTFYALKVQTETFS